MLISLTNLSATTASPTNHSSGGRKIFFWFLEVAVVNSYIIYKEKCLKNKVQAMAGSAVVTLGHV